MDTLGLYISVPFCKAKCSFCNFASGVFAAGRMERYVEQVCAEIAGARDDAARLGAELPSVVDSVYLGGGTPSLLPPELLRRLFGAVRDHFEVTADAEVTLEAAPGQVEGAMLEEMLRQGVNRVSFGVQSFMDAEAAAIGRLHTRAMCVDEIGRMRAAGVKQVGIDLIAGLPHQTEASWRESLAAAVGLELPHVSVYLLEVDEDSRLGREVMAGGTRFHAHFVPEEDAAAELYAMACEELGAAGVMQYEISNFARAGWESRHNRRYWTRAPYLGVGLDAHSMLRAGETAVRFCNVDEMDGYAVRARCEEPHVLSREEAFEEQVFLGLRLVEGMDAAALPGELVARCAGAVEELVDAGLMETAGWRWRLTPRGRLLSNEVFSRLLVGEASASLPG